MLIEKFNSVSETISREMAIRALSKSKRDLAISVTGVASYSDKYSYKDIGLVWFSIAKQKDGDCVSRKQIFKGSRDAVREKAISYALKWLKEETDELKL
jgi:nicotinamide-nucleotide amidase